MTSLSNGSSGFEIAKLIVAYLFSFSLFALAGSIVFFTVEMVNVSKQVPDILVRIDNTSEKIEPTLDEVAKVIDLIPAILIEVEKTRKQITPMVEEIKQIRLQIPAVISEVEQVRKQVPAVLVEVAAVRKELPAVLKSVDEVSDSIVLVSKEVAVTREAMPTMMDRADLLIEKARVAGKEASQGAVTGIFKGIITAPFVLIGDAGKSIAGISEEDAKEYTERDFDLIEAGSLDLLNNGSVNDERKWENAESGNHGVMTLTEVSEESFLSNECRVLNIKLFEKDEDEKEVERTLCRDDDDRWEIDE